MAGRKIYREIKESAEVIGTLDNNEGLWGKVFEDEVMILGNASACKDLEFDQIILASSTGIEEMTKQLEKAGVSRNKIERSYVEVPVYARINFLKKLCKRFRNRKYK